MAKQQTIYQRGSKFFHGGCVDEDMRRNMTEVDHTKLDDEECDVCDEYVVADEEDDDPTVIDDLSNDNK